MLCSFSSFKHSDTFGRIRIMQIKTKHAGPSTWQLHPDKELFNHKTLAVKVTGGPVGCAQGQTGVTKAQAAADLCVFRDLQGSHREQCSAKAGSWLTPLSQCQKQTGWESLGNSGNRDSYVQTSPSTRSPTETVLQLVDFVACWPRLK